MNGVDPHALGAEEHQAQAGHGDMHADGGDEQDQHRWRRPGAGKRGDRPAAPSARSPPGSGAYRRASPSFIGASQNDRASSRPTGNSRSRRNIQPSRAGPSVSRWRDQIERGSGRRRGSPAATPFPASCRIPSAAHSQRAPGDQFALRDENHPGHREQQHQRHAEQGVNRAIDDSVLQQEQNDGRAHGYRAFSKRFKRSGDDGSRRRKRVKTMNSEPRSDVIGSREEASGRVAKKGPDRRKAARSRSRVRAVTERVRAGASICR